MTALNINRFYLTDLRVRISNLEIQGSNRYYEARVDQVPPKSNPPAPPPVRACPPVAACPPARECPPAAACPPARACPPAPVITKIPVSSIINNVPYLKSGLVGNHIDISVRLPLSFKPVKNASTGKNVPINVGVLQTQFPGLIERLTTGGRKQKTKKVKKYKGGQTELVVNPSTYIFRPSTFGFNEQTNNITLPVYFDYYAYLNKNYSFLSLISGTTPSQGNPLTAGPSNNNIVMGIDKILACSFILDKNNIPYYITRIKESASETYHGIIKKSNPNTPYNTIDKDKFFKLDILYNNILLVFRTNDTPNGYGTFDYTKSAPRELNYRSDLMNLQSIPDNISFPNITNPTQPLVKTISRPATLLQPRMALGFELLPSLISRPPAPMPSPSLIIPQGVSIPTPVRI